MDREEIRVRGEELVGKVKDLIHEGNIRKIIIKNDKGETYLEIPLTVGVVGAVLVPIWAALGALAAKAANFRIELIKKDDGTSRDSEPEDRGPGMGPRPEPGDG
jgi:hypothetical protein